jgi:hypothetical protein
MLKYFLMTSVVFCQFSLLLLQKDFNNVEDLQLKGFEINAIVHEQMLVVIHGNTTRKMDFKSFSFIQAAKYTDQDNLSTVFSNMRWNSRGFKCVA